MAKKVIGRCRLCLLDDSELQESHFMPAAIYRSMLERGSKNPNPVLLTPLGAKQIDSQQKAHLLCRECEQRFSRCGEDWVFKHFLRADGTFPIADILKSRPPLWRCQTAEQVFIGLRISQKLIFHTGL
jgi:hypothetical protein